jgi:hypothetical protein
MDRTAVTGRVNDLNDLIGIIDCGIRSHMTKGKPHSLTQDLPFLVYTAAVPRTFQGNKISGICLNIIFHNFPLKGLTADIHENIEFELP